MLIAPLHPKETERLDALAACRVLDSAAEPDFDGLVRLVATLLEVPVSLVSLVSDTRQWFKARVGVTERQTPRDLSFCAHAILHHEGPFIVEDARADARFADNPLVTGALGVVFYAGFPLLVGEARLPVGTLCVIDRRPRTLTATQLDALGTLARQAEVLLEGRRKTHELQSALGQLRRSEERMRAIVSTMHDGVVMQGPDGAIIWNNEGAERILGTSAEQLRTPNKTHWAGLAEDGRTLPREQYPSMVALRTGHGVHDVVMGVENPAGRRWVRINSEPLIEPGAERAWAVVTSFVDITELKQREEELRAAHDVAQRAVKVQGEFLATMSHELRTPMNGVIGMSELLLAEGPRDELQARRLTTIRESGAALLTIINDILDYSKIEAGGRTLLSTAFRPGDVVDGVRALLAPVAAAKELVLEYDEGTAPPAVFADLEATRQVLLNLVSNALKFTGHGAVKVRVTQEAQRCRVAVIDTGLGIAPEHLPRLFQRFSQAEASTTRRFGGTGLGLAISRRLVEGMGGTIGAESQVGVGSTFWFTLPLPPEGMVPVTNLVPRLAAPQPMRALKVLLVEDNPINQRVADGMLKRLGHAVVLAENGREAVEAAQERDFDLVLMDIHMPEMDGLEATRSLRAMGGALARLPIVALTASAMTEERQACFDAGMDEVLTKPLTLATLRACLAELPPPPKLRISG